MPAYSASAPGKAILLGEHAVVYGRPALAVPVSDVRAKATLIPQIQAPRGQISLLAPGIGLQTILDRLPEHHPLAFTLRLALEALQRPTPPAFELRIQSTIPVAAGLGSGAAVSAAVLRVVSAFLGRPFSNEEVCRLAYEVEKLHHGSPSGIDNTVVTYGLPVYFVKGQPVERLSFPREFTLVIGDTGIRSSTRLAVEAVRQAWEQDASGYDALFDRVAHLVEEARIALAQGRPAEIGPLMDENHRLLQEMGVSSPELDRLVETARKAGAQGAKLSGGGRGGNMIALVDAANAQPVAQALQAAGAARTIVSRVKSQGSGG